MTNGEAINLLYNLIGMVEDNQNSDYDQALHMGINSLKAEPDWIPCSERLPEEHEWLGTKKFGTTISDEVFVTFENEKGERFCKHMAFQNGELSRYDKAFIEAWYKGSKPIAWMPLPEPYNQDDFSQHMNPPVED